MMVGGGLQRRGEQKLGGWSKVSVYYHIRASVAIPARIWEQIKARTKGWAAPTNETLTFAT